ncbi:hypothetical protein H5P28_10145 [Ruficoccus amylovorans]|uniref:Uncharacterized protein n=1 Tax=Ruficoccus amylovorans TaxID=1804625 RepID=A0A842HEE6_9BACT|nr:hypothetical protein [Ruficoccus amylovorans]MBC2594619.1 hypothetical protein [Ruficoccus amylovorans]
MKNSYATFSILLCMVAFVCQGQEAAVYPLSPAEADALVIQQMSEKEQQRQAKLAELESATVVESFEVNLGQQCEPGFRNTLAWSIFPHGKAWSCEGMWRPFSRGVGCNQLHWADS